eukprot:651229-Amphidinium_carterae.2
MFNISRFLGVDEDKCSPGPGSVKHVERFWGDDSVMVHRTGWVLKSSSTSRPLNSNMAYPYAMLSPPPIPMHFIVRARQLIRSEC